MIAQILAITIFVVMFLFIISDRIERHIVTLCAALLTLVLVFGVAMHSMSAITNTLNIKSIFTLEFWYSVNESAESGSGINWATIIFISGMMIMVEGMARAGFFRWLCMRLARIVHYRPVPLFLVFMVMSAVLSMFIDSITVILFLAAVTVELATFLKFNPIPMILSEIFCANLGGSATMCGDPPNIIIGTSLGYTFTDFLSNTGVIAGAAMILVMIYFYLVFRRQLTARSGEIDISSMPNPRDAITDVRSFVISTLIFFTAVTMLITHALTGLTVAAIGAFIAAVTLISAPKHIPEIMRRVDYKTILFFIGLFVVVGGLEQTHFLDIIASLIGRVSGGNAYIMVAIIIWLSAAASAFVDNIPFAATMIPIISNLSATMGIPLDTLVWSLSIGTDIGGSATPIGASANVVGTSVAARQGYIITWGRYCKYVVPATVIVLLASTIMIFSVYL